MGRLDEARAVVERLRAIVPVVVTNAGYILNLEHREIFFSSLRLAASETT
jgi:hypothetical protein